jgi:hypothetical protein
MKKTLIILALTMFSLANAQEGTVLVSGNIGYYSQKSDNLGLEGYNYFNFSPKVGYQYNANWTVGVESSINNSKSLFPMEGYSKSNGFSVGGFIRYFKPIIGSFSFYTDLGAGYQNSKRIYFSGGINPSTSTTKADGFYIGVTPALFLDIKKGFGLNFNIGSLGYNTMKNTTNNGSDSKNFNFSFGQAISIGISKNF